MNNTIIITEDMVGKNIIKAFGKSWWLGDSLGRIMDCDVGKKLVLGNHIQMENEEQYRKRTMPNSIKFIKDIKKAVRIESLRLVILKKENPWQN